MQYRVSIQYYDFIFNDPQEAMNFAMLAHQNVSPKKDCEITIHFENADENEEE